MHKQFHRFWTQQEEDTLERLRTEGKTAKQIADVLKRPIHSVKNKLIRLQLSGSRTDNERRLAVLTRPHTNVEAGRILGLSPRRICQLKSEMRKAGIECPAATPERYNRPGSPPAPESVPTAR